MNQDVPFHTLSVYNDSNSFVWTSLAFNPAEQGDIEVWLKNLGFLPASAKIIDMRKISGNILGDDGRTDVLFITEPTAFQPLARLQIEGLKWTSDFIQNYRNDFGGLPLPNDDDDDDEYDDDEEEG